MRIPRVLANGVGIFGRGNSRSNIKNPTVIILVMERLQKRGEEFCTPILSKLEDTLYIRATDSIRLGPD